MGKNNSRTNKSSRSSNKQGELKGKRGAPGNATEPTPGAPGNTTEGSGTEESSTEGSATGTPATGGPSKGTSPPTITVAPTTVTPHTGGHSSAPGGSHIVTVQCTGNCKFISKSRKNKRKNNSTTNTSSRSSNKQGELKGKRITWYLKDKLRRNRSQERQSKNKIHNRRK